MISGKQIHYLIPLFPAFAIFVALAFRQATLKPSDVILPFVFSAFLILLPLLFKLSVPVLDHLTSTALIACYFRPDKSCHPPTVFGISVLIVFGLKSKTIICHALAISLTTLLVMASFELTSKNTLFKNYDLTPIADIIAKNPGVRLAFTRNYHGEWGFLARLDRSVRQMDVEDTKRYIRYFPDAMIFVRTSHPEEVADFDVIFSMPYKLEDTFYIMVKKRQGRAIFEITLPLRTTCQRSK